MKRFLAGLLVGLSASWFCAEEAFQRGLQRGLLHCEEAEHERERETLPTPEEAAPRLEMREEEEVHGVVLGAGRSPRSDG